MKKSFYITTTLPYVNAEPHVGFAMELIQADIIARWKKSQGYDVFFNTGTDEHGLKIYRKAIEAGKDSQDYVDEYARKFKELQTQLGLDESLHFIRTTDEKHVKAAQALWMKCLENGDIYKKKYKGLYCVSDEAFVRESDLVNGRCPNHPDQELLEIEEENYFFNLQKYRKDIREYLQRKDSIIPNKRRNEAISILDQIEDFSISRNKTKLPWGIPVPNDDTQVMYVWFDALTSYISTLDWPGGENFKKFWENGDAVQFAGKDQIKFQSIMWQGMLKSAGLPFTKHIVYHGFLNSAGNKMSKSVGNVISPGAMIKAYGLDPFRAMMCGVNQFEDTDVNINVKNEGFDLTYNANFANGLGNLVSRIMKMAETNFKESPIIVENVKAEEDTIYDRLKELMDSFCIKDAIHLIWSKASGLDQFIQKEQPFKLIKENKEEGERIIEKLLVELYRLALHLEPFMPDTSVIIKNLIKSNKSPEKPLFLRKE